MIRVEKLKKTYDRHGRHANQVLHEVSFTLPQTGFVCILGPSGCGKTSLLNAIGGLDRFDNGSICVDGRSVGRYGSAAFEAERNRNFGYIFQNYYLLMDHSVAYNVYLGLHSLDLSHEEKLARVHEALQAVEMARFARRTVDALSGGQQQRVAIARAIARRPRVIFADEPTGNLDEANTLNICALLRRISKQSLVVMVTHEQRLARFFADRIITLDQGRIVSDETDFPRQALQADSMSLYEGDYAETLLSDGQVQLQLLREEGAPSVKLTVVSLADRIVLKLADERSISCGAAEDAPVLRPGKRPVLRLEELEDGDALFSFEPQRQGKAGQGLPRRLLWQLAGRLSAAKGAKRVGVRLFLLLVTVLSLFTQGDYIALSSVDPRDFITSDSHILQVEIDQGPVIFENGKNFSAVMANYMKELQGSGKEFYFVPHVSPSAQHAVTLFRQMDAVSMKFGQFSYVPLQALDEATLILGRMPERAGEIVVDKWVLENAMAADGIIQNSIYDLSYFLDVELHYSKTSYTATIVGICDSGECSMYVPAAGLISLGVAGKAVTPLSNLQALDPETYRGLTLAPDECLVVTNNAGVSYYRRVGEQYAFSTRRSFTIRDAIEAPVTGAIVVPDEVLEELLWDMVADRFYLYCPDKAEILSFLRAGESEMEREGYALVTVTDRYGDTYRRYEAATTRRADARSIVTFTVLAMSLVMLALLCRAQAQERIGLIAVFRLLGIPKGRLFQVFCLERLQLWLRIVLPACAGCWLLVLLAGRMPELSGALCLPLPAAVSAAAAICLYDLLVSLLPLAQLLRQSPAQLASRYDL